MKIEGVTHQHNLINSQQKVEIPREKVRVNNEQVTNKQESKEKVVSEKEFIESIEKANQALNLRYTSLEFSIHEKTKEIMVKVIDRDSGEVIREIPPEKILDAVAYMWEMAGIIVDEKC